MSLREQLIRHEGIRLRPYRDTLGWLTIGVGRNLESVGISRDEAMLMLDNDILRVQTEVVKALPWTVSLDRPRCDVLLNMAFNLGTAGLLKFAKMLAAVEAGEYATAAKEMLDSKWATQVGARAEELAAIMDPTPTSETGARTGLT